MHCILACPTSDTCSWITLARLELCIDIDSHKLLNKHNRCRTMAANLWLIMPLPTAWRHIVRSTRCTAHAQNRGEREPASKMMTSAMPSMAARPLISSLVKLKPGRIPSPAPSLSLSVPRTMGMMEATAIRALNARMGPGASASCTNDKTCSKHCGENMLNMCSYTHLATF